jgi:integrase
MEAIAIVRQQPRKAAMTSFSADELHKLMVYLYEHDRELHCASLLMLSHGLRRAEVLRLTIHNFRGDKLVTGRVKGSESSTHSLVRHTDVVFDEPATLAPVLAVRNDGRALFDMTPRSINHRLARAGVAVGIDRLKLHSHSFKHTTCHLLLPVLGIPQLQKYVGHVEAKNTLKYLKPTDEEIDTRLAGIKLWA